MITSKRHRSFIYFLYRVITRIIQVSDIKRRMVFHQLELSLSPLLMEIFLDLYLLTKALYHKPHLSLFIFESHFLNNPKLKAFKFLISELPSSIGLHTLSRWTQFIFLSFSLSPKEIV
ncbi:unnamed protein product [Vicia faba]|uniref:Uncharacterized protein n=1 Tax=Vicia faba TaxID=3906 RepID=A0AAV1ACW3_VICFA|nr:unnamed protein product [Vicia faba]